MEGWKGDLCQERYVLHGEVKESGLVVCRDGFRGVLCAEKGCLNDCSNNGKC